MKIEYKKGRRNPPPSFSKPPAPPAPPKAQPEIAALLLWANLLKDYGMKLEEMQTTADALRWALNRLEMAGVDWRGDYFARANAILAHGEAEACIARHKLVLPPHDVMAVATNAFLRQGDNDDIR